MYVILYNPLSNKNKGLESAKKLEKRLSKKHEKFNTIDLLTLEGKEKSFLDTIDKEDIIALVGGDGTLHRFVNAISTLEIPNRIFMYRAGRGNDFSRDHKGKFFEITNDLKNLPRLSFLNEKVLFINGVGIGIDAAVCEGQIANAQIELKESYFHLAIRIFKTFKQFKLDLNIDGNDYHFDDTWFVVVQNGRYFGGGMKIAPKAIRNDDHLDIVVVHKVKVRKLLLIFPFIFFGKHTWFKKVGIEFYTGKNISVKTEGYSTIQHDGDVTTGINEFYCERFYN